jgi:ribosomal protein S18 acetylase RimI-like enzyme
MTATAVNIRLLEEISMSALPALHTVYYDGWVLRFAGGHTRRANSINPLYASQLNLSEKLATCAALYRDQKLPVVFKMTAAVCPADLDAELAAYGYSATLPTSVQGQPITASTGQLHPAVRIETQRSERWLEAYARMNEVSLQRRTLLGRMLDGLITPTGYASIEDSGEIVAVGLGVVVQGYLGLFDIVTAANWRNRGLGRQIVESLLAWGQASGAHSAYLQVLADNAPALHLYSRMGFQELYRYWYRVNS